jgi:phospholipase/carboxylesterase
MRSFETLIKPPILQAKSVVIWLHGLGADGHDFANIVPELNLPKELGIKFIFPHAPIRPVTLNHGLPMRAWFDLYELTASSKVDSQGIKDSDTTLKALIKQEIAHGIPPEKIILVGFSQGGALALYTGLTYPNRLGGIIGLSTFLSFTFLPELHQSKNTPIFIGYGDNDNIVSPELSQISCDYLLSQGYPVESHTYPMAHSVCAAEIKDIAAFLVRILQ